MVKKCCTTLGTQNPVTVEHKNMWLIISKIKISLTDPILLITNTQTTMNNSQLEGDIGNAITMEGDQNDRKWLCFKVLYHIHVSPSLHELSNVFETSVSQRLSTKLRFG
jgi:hypothetical protein